MGDTELFARFLGTSVKKMLYGKAEVKFSQKPIYIENEIVSFAHRMRLEVLGKFEGSTVCSWVHLYTNSAEMEKDNPAGVIIVYLERDYVDDLMRILEYPDADTDDDDFIKESAGAVVNLIAGQFVEELTLQEFPHLQMSHFTSTINSAPNGIKYCESETKSYQINFDIHDRKRLVAEIVLDPNIQSM